MPSIGQAFLDGVVDRCRASRSPSRSRDWSYHRRPVRRAAWKLGWYFAHALTDQPLHRGAVRREYVRAVGQTGFEVAFNDALDELRRTKE